MKISLGFLQLLTQYFSDSISDFMAVTRSSKIKNQAKELNAASVPVTERALKTVSAILSPDVTRTRILRSQNLSLNIQVSNSLDTEKKQSKRKTEKVRKTDKTGCEKFAAVTNSKENHTAINSRTEHIKELKVEDILKCHEYDNSLCTSLSETVLIIESDEKESIRNLYGGSFHSVESNDETIPDRLHQFTPTSLPTHTLYFSPLSSPTSFNVLDKVVDYISEDYLEIINLASTLKQRISKLDALQTNLLLLPPNNIKLAKIQNLHLTVETLIDALAKPWKQLTTISEKNLYLACPGVVYEPVYEYITELENFECLALDTQDDDSYDDLLKLFQ